MRVSLLKDTILALGLILALGFATLYFGSALAVASAGLMAVFWAFVYIGGAAIVLAVLGGIVYLIFKARTQSTQAAGAHAPAAATPAPAAAAAGGHGHTTATATAHATTHHGTTWGISPLTLGAIAAAVIGAGVWLEYFGLPKLSDITGSTTSPSLQQIVYLVGYSLIAGCIYLLIVGKKSVAKALGLLGLFLLLIPISTMLLYKEKINQLLVETAGGSTSVVTTTVVDDGVPPAKMLDVLLDMAPITQRKPYSGCVVAFGPGSESAHMQLSGGIYYFTASVPVQTKLGWFPEQSNKCNN